MRRYAQISGAFLFLVALVQLIRLLLGWPVRVANVDVPVWMSGIPVLVAGGLAAWAFRLIAASKRAP